MYYLVNESTKLCSFCGYVVSDDDVFCNSCGASLTEKVELTAEMPVVAEQPASVVHPQYSQSVIVDYPRKKGNVIAIVSLVFGIIAAVISIIPVAWCLSVVFCAVALITGIIGVLKKKRRYFAVAGMVLGLIGLILYLVQMIGGFYII